jgi:hypothetical protein
MNYIYFSLPPNRVLQLIFWIAVLLVVVRGVMLYTNICNYELE